MSFAFHSVCSFTSSKGLHVGLLAQVFGPVLAKAHCKASPYVFRQLMYGNMQMNLPYSIVDVRDVAKAHVEAMIRPEANGQRFILDGNEAPMTVSALAAKCRIFFPEIQFGRDGKVFFLILLNATHRYSIQVLYPTYCRRRRGYV